MITSREPQNHRPRVFSLLRNEQDPPLQSVGAELPVANLLEEGIHRPYDAQPAQMPSSPSFGRTEGFHPVTSAHLVPLLISE